MSEGLAKAEVVPGIVGGERRLESLYATFGFADGFRASAANKTIVVRRVGVAGLFKVLCHQQPRATDGVEHVQQQGPPQLLGRDGGPTHPGGV